MQQMFAKVYSRCMVDEGAVKREMLKHLHEAAKRIGASRYLMREHDMYNDPNYVRLVAQLSGALDLTEVARREGRRRYDAGSSGPLP